jgi:hypothetical protein
MEKTLEHVEEADIARKLSGDVNQHRELTERCGF